MKPGTLFAAAAAAVALAGAPARAADGILVAQKTTTGTNTLTSQVQIEKNRMRAETIGQNGRKQVVIFDGNAQVMRIVDDEAKTYQELTKEDVERLGGTMSAMMTQMQQQMQNLPPEQRARVEAMMQGRGMGTAAAPIEYKKTGTDKVGRWTCDKYEGTREGKKVMELCTVSPSAAGFTAADFQVTTQLSEFFSKLIPQASERMFRMGTGGPNGFSGIPVRTVSYGGDGSVTTTSEVVDATRQNFSEATFAVPAGYEKRDFMAGRGGRGRGRGNQN